MEAAVSSSPVLLIEGDGSFPCLVEIFVGPPILLMLASACVTAVTAGCDILLVAADSREASAPPRSVCATVEGATDGAPPPNFTAALVRLPSSAPKSVSSGGFTSEPVAALCKIREPVRGFEGLPVRADGGFLKGIVASVLPDSRFKGCKTPPNVLFTPFKFALVDATAEETSLGEFLIEGDGFSLGLLVDISEIPPGVVMLGPIVLVTITLGRGIILETFDSWKASVPFFPAGARVEGGFGSGPPFDLAAA